MLKIEFENRVKNFRGSVGPISLKSASGHSLAIFLPILEKGMKVLGKRAAGCGKTAATLMLTLVSDREIHALNREYRGVDKPTDVLSFSYFNQERFPGDDVVGEIVISVSTARRQAKEHKKTLNQELQFLFLHGLLHVFGFDHLKKAERKKMFDLQDEIVGDKSWRKIAEAEAEGNY